MRARRYMLVVATALAVAALPTSAHAGGGWSVPGRSAYVPAEVATVQGTFWEVSSGASIADGPYIAYISFRRTVGSRATGCRRQRSRSVRS